MNTVFVAYPIACSVHGHKVLMTIIPINMAVDFLKEIDERPLDRLFYINYFTSLTLFVISCSNSNDKSVSCTVDV